MQKSFVSSWSGLADHSETALPLKKSFINARQGVLDPPVKPEDDGG